jgi:hypothetical protein
MQNQMLGHFAVSASLVQKRLLQQTSHMCKRPERFLSRKPHNASQPIVYTPCSCIVKDRRPGRGSLGNDAALPHLQEQTSSFRQIPNPSKDSHIYVVSQRLRETINSRNCIPGWPRVTTSRTCSTTTGSADLLVSAWSMDLIGASGVGESPILDSNVIKIAWMT